MVRASFGLLHSPETYRYLLPAVFCTISLCDSINLLTYSPLPFNCFNRVIMEYGGYDLGKIIKHSRKLAGWSELHVRFISWQILAGLNYLHSANIAHRVRSSMSVPSVAISARGLLPAVLSVVCAGSQAKQYFGH